MRRFPRQVCISRMKQGSHYHIWMTTHQVMHQNNTNKLSLFTQKGDTNVNRAFKEFNISLYKTNLSPHKTKRKAKIQSTQARLLLLFFTKHVNKQHVNAIKTTTMVFVAMTTETQAWRLCLEAKMWVKLLFKSLITMHTSHVIEGWFLNNEKYERHIFQRISVYMYQNQEFKNPNAHLNKVYDLI